MHLSRWTDSLARLEEVRARLLQVIGDQRLRDQMFVVDWNFCNSRGNLISTSFDEIADDLLLEEAYPSLGKPVSEFVDGYLHARETVVILQGPPVTGKTRLANAPFALEESPVPLPGNWRDYVNSPQTAMKSSDPHLRESPITFWDTRLGEAKGDRVWAGKILGAVRQAAKANVTRK